jgi:hypothetical protein
MYSYADIYLLLFMSIIVIEDLLSTLDHGNDICAIIIFNFVYNYYIKPSIEFTTSIARPCSSKDQCVKELIIICLIFVLLEAS